MDELKSYLTIYFALEDSFVNLILWRGRFVFKVPFIDVAKMSFGSYDIGLPINSMLAFICAVSLVEYPDLLPSFVFGSFGWLLIASNHSRSRNLNPWMRNKSFSNMLLSLILGKTRRQLRIEANENCDLISSELNFWDERVKQAEERARIRAEEYARQHEEYLRELEEIGDVQYDLSAQTLGGFALDPTRAYLYPIQQYLGVACEALRTLKNILLWEECYLSFWIVVVSFTLAAITFFVPWRFIIGWTSRIVVWLMFGPWMMAADRFYFSRYSNESQDEKKRRLDESKLKRRELHEKQVLEAQVAREKAAKLRDFKCYLFGKHISHVNLLKKDRYYDLPLSASSATPYNPEAKSLGELAMDEAGYGKTRIEGQQLVGEMIPTVSAKYPTYVSSQARYCLSLLSVDSGDSFHSCTQG